MQEEQSESKEIKKGQFGVCGTKMEWEGEGKGADFEGCLYILGIKPLSIASFETIFSHSVGCLFVFFNGFL